ncbi:DUF4870 domain-containing protein [Gaoshiqia sp. Z1-71]|uniref:DUF4870 domain-containing protein n=1 Tax=Gaoshiqia hydrogeniformans TaxID=3290090 RepID=UPI003BF81723
MERIIDNPDERTWGMLCHLSAFAGMLIPFGNIIGPLVVYSIKRKEFDFVDDQGKEAINFQITMSIAMLAALILSLVIIGIFLFIGIALLSLIFTVVAALKANQGEFYRYPFNYPFVK